MLFFQKNSALNNLEVIMNWAEKTKTEVSIDDAKVCLSRQHIPYDKKGDEHYHCASALQKSIRGSDPNAAMYVIIFLCYLEIEDFYIYKKTLFVLVIGQCVCLKAEKIHCSLQDDLSELLRRTLVLLIQMLLHKLFQQFKAANASFKLFCRDWYYLVVIPCK